MSQTELYRHFDADGNLLYVGMSISSVARLGEHRRDSHWFNAISVVTIERFETRELCSEAEYQAIKNEKPMHNTMLTRAGPTSKKDNGLVNSGEIARALGIDRKTLRKWVREGVCPVKPLDGITPPVWRKADIEQFVGGVE